MMHNKLDSWMKAQNLSNGELAERMNVSPATVSLFANNKRPATDGFKWRFGEVFGFDEAKDVFGESAETEAEHA